MRRMSQANVLQRTSARRLLDMSYESWSADNSRHPFPNPRELFDKSPKGQKAPDSDFAISFPHDKHIDVVTGEGKPPYKPAKGEESCWVCHNTYQPAGESADEYVTKPPADLKDAYWLKKGSFKTTPIGHTVCFTCHSLDSGITPTPQDCNTCHKLRPPQPPPDFDPAIAAKMSIADKIMLTQWRHRESAGAFRHEFSMHADLDCSTCHTVAKMNTLDAKTKKVPISACATCHATATVADGGSSITRSISERKTRLSNVSNAMSFTVNCPFRNLT